VKRLIFNRLKERSFLNELKKKQKEGDLAYKAKAKRDKLLNIGGFKRFHLANKKIKSILQFNQPTKGNKDPMAISDDDIESTLFKKILIF
jgi:hypothetical protein